MVIYAKMNDGREIEQTGVVSATIQDNLITVLLDNMETFCLNLSLIESINFQSA